jgi:hypothetical protein
LRNFPDIAFCSFFSIVLELNRFADWFSGSAVLFSQQLTQL